ncbi:hypothetical protein [Streptosporangium sp. NPDC049644]|uniref:hypothetical protein n=1 Tax=Streptosporangium sp. NPDC049644 TaxID=3155507 RepID=UPI003417B750
MHWLLSRASAQRIALPLIAAVTCSLVLPTSAIAASAPPPDNEVVSAANDVKLIDLGSLVGNSGSVGGINNKGQVAGSISVAHNNDNNKATLFSVEDAPPVSRMSTPVSAAMSGVASPRTSRTTARWSAGTTTQVLKTVSLSFTKTAP